MHCKKNGTKFWRTVTFLKIVKKKKKKKWNSILDHMKLPWKLFWNWTKKVVFVTNGLKELMIKFSHFASNNR